MFIPIAQLFHYLTIGLVVSINSIAVGLGEGLASYSALNAIHIQPKARSEILNANILGTALIETSAVLGLFIAIILLLGNSAEDITIPIGLAQFGICLAICFSGGVLGVVSGLPVQAACNTIAQQPFISQKIVSFMIMTQALIQTPIISALLVSLFINAQSSIAVTISDGLRLLAAGLAVGVGSIGPGIGLALFAKKAIEGLGKNRKIYNKILSFTLLSEAIIETPVIFCMVIAITLLFIVPAFPTENYIKAVCYFASALCIGLGTLGPGISSGKSAGAACFQIALRPEKYSDLSRTSLFAQGLIETVVIYCILMSFLLIFAT